jgi:hypothetical protein
MVAPESIATKMQVGHVLGKTKSLIKQIWSKSCRSGPENTCQPTLLGHCLITGGLLSLVGSSFLGLNWYASTKADDWFQKVERLTPPSQNAVQEPAAQVRLKEQLDEIQQRIDRHAKVMIYFYKQYFVSLSMTSGLALFAAICVFFISRDGWEKAHNGLINAFIVTSSAALLYGHIPGLFRQEINLKANRDLYLSYVSLGDEVLSYLATGGNVVTDTNQAEQFIKIEPAQFIHDLDRQLADLNKVPIEFDATQAIKVPDFRQIDPQSGAPILPTPGQQ